MLEFKRGCQNDGLEKVSPPNCGPLEIIPEVGSE